MKKLRDLSLFLLSGAAFLIALGFAGGTPASAFGTWTWKKIEPIAYKVSANGTDLRVYEWESERVPGKFCVSVFADAGPGGTTCSQVPNGIGADEW